jgi:hypothetical protein
MIENIRKYSGLMIVVFVILFISFFLMDSGGSRAALGGGGTALRIEGRSYSHQDLQRHGSSAYRLISSIASNQARVGDFSLLMTLSRMVGNAGSEDEAEINFFTSRILLREASTEFGIHPGAADIEEYLRGMSIFAGSDGEFNPTAYRDFIDNQLGRIGMTERDLRDLVSDILRWDRLSSIIGGGLSVHRDVVAANRALESQQITAILAKLDLAPYLEKMDPTEEEVRSYWELIQDSFTTPVRRKFTYIVAKPEAVEDPVMPEETLDLRSTDLEAMEALRKEREAQHADKLAEAAEARRAAAGVTAEAVDTFLQTLEDADPSKFEELARAAGWEPQTTELFAANEPPVDLDVMLRSSSGGGNASSILFAMKQTTDPFSRISDALPVGEHDWLVARLDGEEPSRTKTFEEAKEEAREQYISEKAAEAMKTAGEEAIAAINEALAAGTPFADAARAAGIEQIKEVEKVTAMHRPEGSDEPQNLFKAASTVDPGSIAELIVESDRAFILFVAKREVIRDEPGLTLESELARSAMQQQTIAFDAWMRQLIETAKIDRVGLQVGL